MQVLCKEASQYSLDSEMVMQIYTFLSKRLLKTPHRWLKWSLLSMVLYCFHSLIRKLLVCSHSSQGEMQSVSLAELALKVSFWSLFETHPPRQLAFQSLDSGKRIENIWRSQLVEQLIKCTLTCLERCLPMVAPQLLQPVPGQLFPTLWWSTGLGEQAEAPNPVQP